MAEMMTDHLPHPPRAWIGVASADHVRLGRAGGFMQLCHGKAAPLRRLSPGDRIIYYSPSTTFRGKDRAQSLTAIGTVAHRAPYQVEMHPGFIPWRRDMIWQDSAETPIQPLRPRLSFASGANWGYQLRFGLFEISEDDAAIIAAAMHPEA